MREKINQKHKWINNAKTCSCRIWRWTKFCARWNKKGKYACLLGRVLIHNIHNHSHADLSFFSSLHVFFIIKFCTSMLLYIIYAFIVLVQFFYVCFWYLFEVGALVGWEHTRCPRGTVWFDYKQTFGNHLVVPWHDAAIAAAWRMSMNYFQ